MESISSLFSVSKSWFPQAQCTIYCIHQDFFVQFSVSLPDNFRYIERMNNINIIYTWERKRTSKKKNVSYEIFSIATTIEKKVFFCVLLPIFPLNIDQLVLTRMENALIWDLSTKEIVENEIENKSTPHYFTLFQFPSTYQSLELAKVRQQFNKNERRKKKRLSHWNSVNAFIWSMALLAVLCPFAHMSNFNVIIIWTYLLSTCHR